MVGLFEVQEPRRYPPVASARERSEKPRSCFLYPASWPTIVHTQILHGTCAKHVGRHLQVPGARDMVRLHSYAGTKLSILWPSTCGSMLNAKASDRSSAVVPVVADVVFNL